MPAIRIEAKEQDTKLRTLCGQRQQMLALDHHARSHRLLAAGDHAPFIVRVVMNQIRGFLLDRGLAVRKGPCHLRQVLPLVLDESSSLFSGRLRWLLKELPQEWNELERRLEEVSHEIETIAKHNEVSLRLMEIPGFGPLVSTALTAAVGNGATFRKARDLAAWLGLVPRQHSTGSKTKLLGISKRGNECLRRMFLHGARSVVMHMERKKSALCAWLAQLAERTHKNVAVVAFANKSVNVGFAKLQLVKDLGFSEAVYGFGAGIFFLGYLLFEIPSNLFLERTGARNTFARITILWGFTTIATMFVKSAISFYILRFLLGTFEAGLYGNFGVAKASFSLSFASGCFMSSLDAIPKYMRALIFGASRCGLSGLSVTSPPPWNDAPAPMRPGTVAAVLTTSTGGQGSWPPSP